MKAIVTILALIYFLLLSACGACIKEGHCIQVWHNGQSPTTVDKN